MAPSGQQNKSEDLTRPHFWILRVDRHLPMKAPIADKRRGPGNGAVDFPCPKPENPMNTRLGADCSMSYIPFPPLSPEIFAIDLFGFNLALRWYALAYIIGLVVGWKLIIRALRTSRLWITKPPMTEIQMESLFTWVIIGVILGGRFGYILFYQLGDYLAEPARIIRVWEGGMSFHGGFAGVAIVGIVFCWRHGISALSTGDLFAMVAPIGLGLGRLANFINAELWGRPTDLPWGVAFPGQAAQACEGVLTICARHPSQLYEALLEGLLLGLVLAWLIWRRDWLRFPGRAMGLFVAGYGAARFLVEFVRQPDGLFVSAGNPLGLAWQIGGYGLTQGQALSIPMILVGLWFLLRAKPA
jgi:phosphatidylglycerol:prolipoprotein diacylglycerol transferase